MKRLVVAAYAIPILLTVGASVTLMEPIIVGLIGAWAFAAAVLVTSVLVGFARHKREPAWPVCLGGFLCLALIASVVVVHWPLRAGYYLSRPSFEEVALDVREGKRFAGPMRVGLFTIVQAEVEKGDIVCLWTDPNPGGREGFVQCPPDHVPFNLWSMATMDDRWQFIAED